MTLYAIAYSAFLWWFSTGVIFYLNKRPASTFRWSVLGGTIVLFAALYGLWLSARQETVIGAYTAFSCGLIIWGWHTMTYYMGIITGPRREPCPPDCGPFERFYYAFSTGLYHELAIVAKAILMAWLTWEQPNQFGLWTFLLLWGMHVSAKLNVFLGIRNLNIEFIPDRLAYLTSYFRQKPMNLLFPFSVTAGTILTMVLIQQAMVPDVAPFLTIGFILLATLSALAVIEHWFMILPIPAEALWRWSPRPSKDADGTAQSEMTRSQV
jgi:putative photosynthetic complex assembly protein 2